MKPFQILRLDGSLWQELLQQNQHWEYNWLLAPEEREPSVSVEGLGGHKRKYLCSFPNSFFMKKWSSSVQYSNNILIFNNILAFKTTSKAGLYAALQKYYIPCSALPPQVQNDFLKPEVYIYSSICICTYIYTHFKAFCFNVLVMENFC